MELKEKENYIASDKEVEELSKLLNTEPTVKEEILPVPAIVEISKEEKTNDFEYAREQLRSAIDKAAEALDVLSELAENSRHPRAFEVVGILVKTIAEASKDLLTIHKQKLEIDIKEITKDGGSNTVNNNLFVGSTKELDEIIKKLKEV